MEYIWIEDETPINDQIIDRYRSAAILLNPFVEMSEEYVGQIQNKDIGPHPSEVIVHGKAISWSAVLGRTGLDSYEQLEIALQTSIGALNWQYANEDLAERLLQSLPPCLFMPDEDTISEFFLRDFCQYLQERNKTKLCYHDPLTDNRGVIDLKDCEIDEIYDLFVTEMYICDDMQTMP